LKNRRKKLRILLSRLKRTRHLRRKLKFSLYSWNVLRAAPNNTSAKSNRFYFRRNRLSSSKETTSRRSRRKLIILKKNMKMTLEDCSGRSRMERKGSRRRGRSITT
jgi:hypothetical protein